MVDRDAGREGGEFVWPERKEHGLEPEEQVILFGNPPQLNAGSIETLWVLEAKAHAAAKYLASFIDPAAMPDDWNRRYSEALQQERSHEDMGWTVKVDFPKTAQEYALFEAISDYGLVDQSKTPEEIRAARQLVQDTLELSVSGDVTGKPLHNKSYIESLIRARAQWLASDGWAELPKSPWGVPASEYPLAEVLNKAQYGSEWEEKGREFYAPEQDCNLTAEEQIVLFADPILQRNPDLGYEWYVEDSKVNELKSTLAARFLAPYVPRSEEWQQRLLKMQTDDAEVAAAGGALEFETVEVAAVRRAMRVVEELGMEDGDIPPGGEAFVAALQNLIDSAPDNEKEIAKKKADYILELVLGPYNYENLETLKILPEAPWRSPSGYPAWALLRLLTAE